MGSPAKNECSLRLGVGIRHFRSASDPRRRGPRVGLRCIISSAADLPAGQALRMSGGRVERRLAAILAVDVAGYSRLMGADEEGRGCPGRC